MPSTLRRIDNRGKPDAWALPVLVRMPPTPAHVRAQYRWEAAAIMELARQAQAADLVRT